MMQNNIECASKKRLAVGEMQELSSMIEQLLS